MLLSANQHTSYSTFDYVFLSLQTQIETASTTGGVVAPISGQSPAFQKSQVNHNVRQVGN